MRTRDPYVELARSAVEHHVHGKGRLSAPPGLPAELVQSRRGTFVTLNKGGMLRGCIGTCEPSEDSLAEEIIANAIRAATEDPRFPPVTRDELPELAVSVDVLGRLEPCTASDLDPRRYGVVVKSRGRRGLLLPDLPGVDTVEEQLRIAEAKGGISAHEPCRLWRFTVERHTG